MQNFDAIKIGIIILIVMFVLIVVNLINKDEQLCR